MNSEEPSVSFAYWEGSSHHVRVSYSLPLFHEVDFYVNEGFRRIPHGGVEVGGVLYGRLSDNIISLEAFRPIECEHASGPSFILSDRDVENLKSSILAASAEEELAHLRPLGWFIAHTRSGLRMTDREIELFHQFFPEPMRVTVLAKPERFKPTRFAFLVRDAQKKLDREGDANAIILPLPGRAGKQGAIDAPSIPAPVSRESIQPTAPPLQAPAPPELHEKPSPLPAAVAQDETVQIPRPSGLILPQAPDPFANPTARAAQTTPPILPPLAVRPPRFRWMLVVLFLAAVLGCAGGYWAYLQLPSPVIDLRVQKRENDMLILWNPEQTRNSDYPVIRVNDGRPVLLTDEQRTTGTALVPLAPDTVKVEVVAPHWGRNSRGIVRYVSLRSNNTAP